MPSQLGPLLFFALRALGALAAPPPPPGASGPSGGNGPVPIGQLIPPALSSPDWPTSTGSKWMTASYTSSLVASSSDSRTATTTSATQSAFSTTVSYSNGANRSLASCAASMNGSVPSSLGFDFSGTIRRYYVAAEEVEWDYAPTGWDNWLGVSWNGP
jgi:hypothetical protein